MTNIRKSNRRIVAACSALALVSACAGTPTVESSFPEDIAGDMHHLTYDVVAVNVESSMESQQSLAIEGGGQAAKDGFKLMAQAPIGCLGGGVFAGACYALMPFFPVITMARAENPALAREELETLYGRIEDYGLHAKLEERLLERMATEKLPQADVRAPDPDSRLIAVNVFTSPMQLQHSGYKKGYIDVTIPYTIEVTDRAGQVLARKSGKVSRDFSHDERDAELYSTLDVWLDLIVETGINKMLIEWQPEIVLGYRYPTRTEKRTWLGFKVTDWAPVDSLTPRIEWTGLADLMPADRMAGITDLTYELALWGYGSDLGVYPYKRHEVVTVAGLAEPAYQLDIPLVSCQRYYWAVKARFWYLGVMRTTSLANRYELRTGGPGCKDPNWILPNDFVAQH